MNDTPISNDAHQELARLEAKVDVIYASVEKTRKYFLASLIITVAVFVLPLVGLVFAIPVFLSTYSDLNNTAILEGL